MSKSDPKADSVTRGRKRGRDPVEKSLRERIKLGFYGSGERLPSERELSKEFGVSRASIQAAIRNLATDGFICQLHNCRPVVAGEPKGSEAASANQQLVAVWIQPNLQDFGAATILQGIRAATDKAGCSLLVGFPSESDRQHAQNSEVKFLEMVVSQPNVVGAIVWETESPAFRRIFEALTQANLPVVFIDREPPVEIEADVVSVNNRRGARAAVEHLISLGHRRIAMVLNVETASSVRERIEGYRDALRTIGADEQFFTLDPDQLELDPSACLELTRQIFDQDEPPTAIFCVNDGIALRMQRSVAGLGLRVPENVSLVGFDWFYRSLPFGGDLTTVAQPFDAIGRIAAERLLERIGDDAPSPTRHILLEATLVVKSTSGPPALSPRSTRETISPKVQQ